MAAGLAVFEFVSRREFLEGVRRKGEYLRVRLEELSSRAGQDRVRGQGLLLAMGLDSDGGPRIVEEAFFRRLLLNSPRPDTLRCMPALTVSEEGRGDRPDDRDPGRDPGPGAVLLNGL